jgi:CubicO group peptidase (beta-lactamase class C family)
MRNTARADWKAAPGGPRREWITPILGAALVVGCATGSADRAAAQRPSAEKAVDSIVVVEGLDRGVPAVAVAIVADGQVVFQRGYGYADRSTGRVATAATPFNIASVTKPFVSAVTMQLVEEGKIALSDPVRRHLPWLPSRYAEVTVQQLLTHTSGIARDLRVDNFDDPDARIYRARLDTASASAGPGEQFEYSNTGYTVLGWLVEAVEGRPLAQVLEQRIFQPLGMRHARYRATLEEDPLRALPHAMEDGRPVLAKYITGGFGSGGVSMSATDAAAFGIALQEGRFLSAAAREQVWRPSRLGSGEEVERRMFGAPASYGFGWFLTSYEGRRMYTHGGGIEGYSANLYHFPAERLTIVVLANIKGRDDGVAPVDPIARRIADFCLTGDGCRLDSAEAQMRAEIRAANQAFSAAYVAGDTAAIRSMYVDDGKALLPRGLYVRGNRDVAALFRAPSSTRRLVHALYSEGLTRYGDAIIEVGSWFDKSERGEGTGRYTLTWVPCDSGWCIAMDAWVPSESR